MRRLWSPVAVAVLALTTCFSGCIPAPPAGPPSDNCTKATPGGIDGVELGAATSADLAGAPTTFAPLHDGDGLSLLYGSQGATMLGFILRVSGDSAPACLGQQTVVDDPSGAFVTSATAPVTTYAQPDGTRVTHPMWLPAAYPPNFVVSVTALDQSLALHLHVSP